MSWEWDPDDPSPRFGCAVVVLGSLMIVVTAWSILGGWW